MRKKRGMDWLMSTLKAAWSLNESLRMNYATQYRLSCDTKGIGLAFFSSYHNICRDMRCEAIMCNHGDRIWAKTGNQSSSFHTASLAHRSWLASSLDLDAAM